jgi:hypothetical protein
MQEIPKIQRFVAVLWPSFLTAGVATVLFFTAFDPQELGAAMGFEEVSRLEVYSVGFFLFWSLTTVSSTLTVYFQKPCDQINPKLPRPGP